MRYTTIIDVSAIPELYRNRNATFLYLHLCLKSGYHDYNRDAYKRSIRGLALETDLSVSAVRHSIKVLTRYKLITQKNGVWLVRKYIQDQTITPRKKKQSAKEQELVEERLRQQRELEKSLKQQSDNAISYEEYKRQIELEK